MTFSREIKGTDKTKMNWWEYWVGHCFMTGWTSMYYNFQTWADLVWFSDNQKNYPILKDDDPFEQCYLTFWYDLGADDTYPQEFLEYLMGLADEVEKGEVELIPLSETFFDDLEKELNDD
jgi:hypothetical protein